MSALANESVLPDETGLMSISEITASGVASSNCTLVLSLATSLGIKSGQFEPLCDPLTLERFLNARNGDVASASEMYRTTIAWRASKNLNVLMDSLGTVEGLYDERGCRTSPPSEGWDWKRSTSKNSDCEKIHKFGFHGKMSSVASEDSSIAIWRLGKFDLSGIKSNNLLPLMESSFITHLEDLLQSGRTSSHRHSTLIRARLIVDLSGVSMSLATMLPTIKKLLGFGKLYFPECTKSATLINAPWVFSSLWGLVNPFLTDVMKKKVKILGNDWKLGEVFLEHSGVEVGGLPAFLDGNGKDEDVCCAESVS
ncbi:hypothetical protein TrST_g14019 [Triparma strigata]|uniref:CRAL-TRIO domain-containing protein n=1 Tax=Triparma strigata TaxID=1606541 RepID=A0A9W7AUN5_9STRA|nr:hypothetical protein TrST_g14019 [Triparma strigata]